MSYEQFERDAINSTIARESYSRYLQSFDWDYFATVTFRKDWRDSIKAHETVWENLAPYCSRAFLAVERHRYPNYNCHVHGLLKTHTFETGSPMFTPEFLWVGLYVHFGRTQVEEIREMSQVSNYCSKYVVKRLSDYAFYGSPSFWSK